jgi:hypothetical protein
VDQVPGPNSRTSGARDSPGQLGHPVLRNVALRTSDDEAAWTPSTPPSPARPSPALTPAARNSRSSDEQAVGSKQQ